MTDTTATRRHVIHLARTGERLEVEAPSVPEALRRAGRRDACLLEERPDLDADSGRAIDATFNPEAPTIITARSREATPAELKAWALSLVANELERQAAGQRRAEEVRQ